MARLVYSAIASLDGYVVDASGQFDWAAPDEEVHAHVNDLLRPLGTQLYGRRTYEVMTAWETMPTGPDEHDVTSDFARIWRGADKVVYSRTLADVSTARTRLERRFDAAEVRAMKESADLDLALGGPTLAATAFAAGLVDDVHLYLVPEAVGGGTPALPPGGRLSLDLVDERRFANGTVYLRYGVGAGPAARSSIRGVAPA